MAAETLTPFGSDKLSVRNSILDQALHRSGEGFTPCSAGKIARVYETLLSELIFNSKAKIDELTMIAGELTAHGEAIAESLCCRIIKAPVDQKLPALYLLDSIVKNVGKEFIVHFSSRLSEVFCESFKHVDSNLHCSMRRLFGTWSAVFPPQVLREIELKLQFTTQDNDQIGASRLSNGAHVSSRNVSQSEHSTVHHIKNSPKKFEKSSPSQRNNYSEDARNQLEASTSSNIINEPAHQRLRALIDAYGKDDGGSSLNLKPVADHPAINKVAAVSWQDTEEQEFDWKDMKPSVEDVSLRSECKPSAASRITPLHCDPGLMKLAVSGSDSTVSHCPREISIPQTSWHITKRGTTRKFSTAFPSDEETRSAEKQHAIPTSVNMQKPRLPLSKTQIINSPCSMIPVNPAVIPINPYISLPPSQNSHAKALPLPLVSASHHAMPPTSLNVTQGFSPVHLPQAPMPPFPPQPVSHGPSNPSAGGGLSGLISSLMDRGLISLDNQATVQDSVGEEFDHNLLKVRRESVIRALYADLPRQCTSCGLRFRTKEEHSKHMDWHVTKNRSRAKAKTKPNCQCTRKWYVSKTMWLIGAEAAGAEAVPLFLKEKGEEKKGDEEMNVPVPADEDQNMCALCREKFVDFYDHETEEWMYKGAVYLNAHHDGSCTGLDRSQLGPIVHAKCRQSRPLHSERWAVR